MQGILGNVYLNKFNEDKLVLEKHEAEHPDQESLYLGINMRNSRIQRVLQLLIALLEEQEQVKVDYELL